MKGKRQDLLISMIHTFWMLTHPDGLSLKFLELHLPQGMVIHLFLLDQELLFLEEKDLKEFAEIFMLLTQ